MERRTNAEMLKEGDVLSEVQYYTVVERRVGYVMLKNERGMQMQVSNAIVQEGMFSANQFSTEQKVTRTEMVEILAAAGDTVFTANFNTKIKDEDILEKLKTLYANEGGKIVSKSEYEKRAKAIVKLLKLGTERTLVGRLLTSTTKFGRFQVIDLEIQKGEGAYDNRIRQIDSETLNWLILKNVRYILKK